MWVVVSPFTHRPLFLSPISAAPRPTKPTFLFTVTATSPPHSRRSSSEPKYSQQQTEGEELDREKQREPTGTKQLNGLDVLWAMQRAAAEKKRSNPAANKKAKSKILFSGRSRGEEDDLDYSNVRPLSIKSDWRVRLDALEKRLAELSASK